MEAQPRYSPKGAFERQPVIVFFFTKFVDKLGKIGKASWTLPPAMAVSGSQTISKPRKNEQRD
jgi:hypothetical protein